MNTPPTHRRLFFDDAHVQDLRGVGRQYHQAAKCPDNPVLVPDQPWERAVGHNHGTVILGNGHFRMWYAAYAYPSDFSEPGMTSMHCAFAESADGITWEKPELGLIEIRGTKMNNLAMTDLCWINIIEDPRSDADERYTMLYFGRGAAKPGAFRGWLAGDGAWGWCLASSPERLRWQPHADNPVYTDAGDAGSLLGWDERQQQYVAYLRPWAHSWVESGTGHDAKTVPTDQFMEQYPYCRMIGRTVSDDLVHWSTTQTVIGPDGVDSPDSEYYSMPVLPYQGWYVGLLYMLHAEPGDPNRPRKQGLMDTRLAFSRDGITWQRPDDRQPLIARGARGEWDMGMVGPNQGLIEKDGKIWLYYSGMTGEHRETKAYRKAGKNAGLFAMGRLNSGIGLAWLRQDGFVSLDAGDEPGVIATRAEQLDNGELVINAVTAADGYVAAEIISVDGPPATGYSAADCDRFVGDEVAHRVTWRGRGAAELSAGTYSLRFVLRNASLYSYTVIPR